MKTDTEIHIEGVHALINTMGNVEAERFITLILREPFDYTKWQKDLWPNKSISEISNAAMELRKQQGKKS